MSGDRFFCATNISIGACANASCRAVHIGLLDQSGDTRAQAVIGCDAIDEIAIDLKKVKNRILGIDVPGAPSFADIEKLVVDYFDAHEADTQERGAEWFLVDGDTKTSLTGLAAEIVRRFGAVPGNRS